MGRVSWITRVMGQLSDKSRGSWVTKYDPLSALVLTLDALARFLQRSRIAKNRPSYFALNLRSHEQAGRKTRLAS